MKRLPPHDPPQAHPAPATFAGNERHVMKDPGSGTGKSTSNSQPKPLKIEGWVHVPSRDPDERHYRPDPRHPLHPYNRQQRKRPRLRSELERDPALSNFVASHLDHTREQLS